jgi:hypothetical protein
VAVDVCLRVEQGELRTAAFSQSTELHLQHKHDSAIREGCDEWNLHIVEVFLDLVGTQNYNDRTYDRTYDRIRMTEHMTELE